MKPSSIARCAFLVLIGIAVASATAQDASPSPERFTKIPFLKAAEQALAKVGTKYDLSKPHEITARPTTSGEWVFMIYFLPKVPDTEINVTVGTNGVTQFYTGLY